METEQSIIKLSTGNFKIEELEAIFSNMPFEVSFVDKDDIVRFFNNKTERFFLRAQAAIGKDMRFCHPKKYLPMVEQILSDFKSGKENHALFWRADHKGKFISIEYFAMRDENLNYIGILEIVQDITNIRLLEGDRNELVYDKKE
jgi:PAS domain S-box-containing protein